MTEAQSFEERMKPVLMALIESQYADENGEVDWDMYGPDIDSLQKGWVSMAAIAGDRIAALTEERDRLRRMVEILNDVACEWITCCECQGRHTCCGNVPHALADWAEVEAQKDDDQ